VFAPIPQEVIFDIAVKGERVNDVRTIGRMRERGRTLGHAGRSDTRVLIGAGISRSLGNNPFAGSFLESHRIAFAKLAEGLDRTSRPKHADVARTLGIRKPEMDPRVV